MLLEKFIEGIANQDLSLLESLLHEEMLFLQEKKWRQKRSG